MLRSHEQADFAGIAGSSRQSAAGSNFYKINAESRGGHVTAGADHVKVTEAEDNDVTLKRNLFHCGGGGPFIQ